MLFIRDNWRQLFQIECYVAVQENEEDYYELILNAFLKISLGLKKCKRSHVCIVPYFSFPEKKIHLEEASTGQIWDNKYHNE